MLRSRCAHCAQRSPVRYTHKRRSSPCSHRTRRSTRLFFLSMIFCPLVLHVLTIQYGVSYRIFFGGGGEVIVVACVSTPAHASTCVPPRGGGGGGVWGHASQENFDFLDCNPGHSILFDDTYQITKHHTKLQDFWGGGGGGGTVAGGDIPGPPPLYETLASPFSPFLLSLHNLTVL